MLSLEQVCVLFTPESVMEHTEDIVGRWLIDRKLFSRDPS